MNFKNSLKSKLIKLQVSITKKINYVDPSEQKK